MVGNQRNNCLVNPDQVKEIVNASMSQYFWWFVGAAIALWVKNVVENMVSAAVFFFSKDYSVDDEVFIGGNRKARIVRQTFTETVFYMYDNNTRLIVSNKDFYNLRCEKVLPGLQKPQ